MKNDPKKWTFLNVVVVDTETITSTKLYKNQTETSKIIIYKPLILCSQKSSLTSFYILKNPDFKDPMRFLFWTFLDIFKMSIFGFLEEMFFMRTEKSENKNVWKYRSENGKENNDKMLEFLRNFGK